jgi:hypothetical protein
VSDFLNEVRRSATECQAAEPSAAESEAVERAAKLERDIEEANAKLEQLG